MIRPKLPLRRPLAVTAGLLLGVAGAVALAAPASAHHPEISGTGCKLSDGAIKVVWTVSNSERDWDASIQEISSPSGAPISGLEVGTKLPKKSSNEQPPTGEQTVPAGQTAQLSVKAFWDKDKRDVTSTRTGAATVTGNCEEPEPTPTPTVPEPTTPPTTPPATTPPATTPPVTPSTTPSVPEPGEPSFEVQETCDELSFVVNNPADGPTITVTLTSEKGEVKTLKATPGEETSVSFDAYEGLTITPSIEGKDAEPVKWTKPEDCGGGGGGDLPLTGAAAGGIAGGAVLLLAAGVVLYVVARRRRVTFTA